MHMSQTETRRIRLSRRAVLAFAALATFVAGTLFSTAAAAAGIHSPDLLALIFALGSFAMLFALVVWYLAQLARIEGAMRERIEAEPAFIHRGTPWTQHRRPPSGSTIMWSASALRRKVRATLR
jgi:uncharacterized protein (DUF1501 family)